VGLTQACLKYHFLKKTVIRFIANKLLANVQKEIFVSTHLPIEQNSSKSYDDRMREAMVLKHPY